MIVNNYLSLDAEDCLHKISDHHSLANDSSDSSENKTSMERDWKDHWKDQLKILGFARGGGSSSPGNSSAGQILGLGRYIIIVDRLIENLLSGCVDRCSEIISIICGVTERYSSFGNLFFVIPDLLVWVFLLATLGFSAKVCYEIWEETRQERLSMINRLNLLNQYINSLLKGKRIDILYRMTAYSPSPSSLDWIRLRNNIPQWSLTSYKRYNFPFLLEFLTSIGVKCVDKLEIPTNSPHQRVLVQLTTRAYDHRLSRYVQGLFHILVYSGIGLVIWYKFIPVDGTLWTTPTEVFMDPYAVVEGYKKINTVCTPEDITSEVINCYRNSHPFQGIFSYEALSTDNVVSRTRLASIGISIMMGILLTSNALLSGQIIT